MPGQLNLMPPSISRTPEFSNQFAFPLEFREIGIPLYFAKKNLILTTSYEKGYLAAHRGILPYMGYISMGGWF